ncbi:hypothetical protein EUX98_g2072 [Antrodiella citrinella]|uniref:Cytochrome P450 n=1 Tax=Antrodiella citrinella TaxID=2447956 RepID=A0A4S4N2X7_9APHY|nr:hypothetical protein EUX98_g2072 [Antrodiella citrinella]
MSDGILAFPSILHTVPSLKATLALALVASLCYVLPFFCAKMSSTRMATLFRLVPSFAILAFLYVVISDPHIARDIFVNNGAIFSSRKDYFIKNQSILRGRAITASQYNDKWRNHRRIAGQFMTPKAVAGFANEIDYEAHILMQTFYTETAKGAGPVSPQHDTVRYALNVMLIMALGIRTEAASHPFVDRTLELTLEFNDLTGPLSNIEDFITPLQWFNTNLKKRGRKLHDAFIEVYGALLLEVKAKMDNGEDVPDCLAKTLLLTREQEGLDWEDMCMLIAVFVLGGVHSTAGIIQWFMALLPAHPEVQRRAHEELDAVVGQDSWPTAEDEARLPYCRAIIKEVLRVHAPFWMATPHYSTEDFVYKGYFIPKSTSIVLNCYTLHHDERRYPDAHAFSPERYIDDHLSCADSAKLSNVMERDHWTFGAGRRICPGMAVAERELWLAISRILWSFTVHEMPNEPISLEEYEGQSGRTPKPFRVRLIPRHDRVHSLLQSRDEISL